MVEARAGCFDGYGEPDGMDENSGFQTEFGGDAFERSFKGGGLKGGELRKRVAELLQARLVFGNEMVFGVLPVIHIHFREIKAGVAHQFGEGLYFSVTGR